MSRPRTEIQLKFGRARELAAELTSVIQAYLAESPFAVHEVEDTLTGDLVYRAEVRKDPPSRLSILIGDALHNTRTALDHLAWQLVLAGGGTPSRNTYFPITASPPKFQRALRDCLAGADSNALAAVGALRPYGGGDDRFWLLHQLDIEDKHHLLIPVGSSQRSVNIDLQLHREGEDPIAFPPLALVPADNAYPIRTGTDLFRIMAAARQPEGPFKHGHSISFDVAFGDGSIVKGQPIVPTVPDLCNQLEQATAPLLRFLP